MQGSKQAWMNHICQVYGIKVDVLWLSRSHFISCVHLLSKTAHKAEHS